MDALINTLITNYGFLGIVTVVLCGYIVRIQGTHSKERSEFYTQHQKNTEILLEVTNKNTEANTGLKNVIEAFMRKESK